MQVKKEGMRKGIYFVIFSLFLVLFIISMVSAGLFDWMRGITGMAQTRTTNVSITLTGTAQVTINVWNYTLTNENPTENGTSRININLTVTDTNGFADINQSMVNVSIIRTGEVSRVNTTCVNITNQVTANSLNFTCDVYMWYWDRIGTWTINATANDLGNATPNSNSSMVVDYKQLQAIVIDTLTLTWPSVTPGATNQTSNNDPTVINNTGNYNVTSGNIEIQGIDLYGPSGNFINVSNFTADIASGNSCTGAACIECDGNALGNGTYRGVNNSFLSPGNLSNYDANETIYFCLTDVPSGIPSETYDTTQTGSSAWTLRIV